MRGEKNMNIENKHRICLPIYTDATKILLLSVPVPCVNFHHRFSYRITTHVREIIDPTFCWPTKDASQSREIFILV